MAKKPTSSRKKTPPKKTPPKKTPSAAAAIVALQDHATRADAAFAALDRFVDALRPALPSEAIDEADALKAAIASGPERG
jgi:hypothetical protein